MFDKTFKADDKCIAAGQILDDISEEMTEDVALYRQHFLLPKRHNISTWFGCSGGLVGIPRKEPFPSKTDPVIVGLGKVKLYIQEAYAYDLFFLSPGR